MKRLLLILFIGYYGTTYSQLSLDSLFIPTVGTIITFNSCDTAGVNISPPGTNQIFDYQFLTINGTAQTEYVDPLGSAGFSSFPNATLAVNLAYSTRFYRTTSDSFLYIGQYNNSLMHWNDKWDSGLSEQLPFMQYDSLYTDTAYMAYYTPSLANRIVIKKWKVDAYGKLLLPANTYDTVYRVLTDIEFHNANNFNLITEHYTDYTFISPLLKHSVFAVHYGQSGSATTKKVKYTGSITGIENTDQDNYLQVYPNPFTDKLYLSNSKAAKIKNIQLVNLLGTELLNESFTSNPEMIELPDFLVSGIYILNIETDKGMLRLKIIKQ